MIQTKIPVAGPKQPAENLVYTFDYSQAPQFKDRAETITNPGTVAATPSGLTIGTVAIATRTGASISDLVNVRISGGTAGVNYKVTNTGVITSGSNTLEGEFTLPVRDL